MGSTKIPVITRETNDPGSSIKVMFDKTNITNIDYSDYQLNIGAGPSYILTRVADNSTIALDLVVGPPDQLVASTPNTDTLPGISIEATGLVAGDSYLIRPTYAAANSIAHNITETREIALATNKSPDNSYTINGPMPGDNRNGLALAGLENNLNMLGGTATFQDTYGLVVSEVGTLTRSAQISEAAQETLLNSAKEEWGNVSGVNLDEEAANLVKFQQSYQAAAQVISVSQTLFDSLLGAVN
jgi:flagellar hook-associated protein 1 FlgK